MSDRHITPQVIQNQEEDIGMMKDATDMHAVFANIDILDDSVITAVNKDAELMQKMILTLSCSNLPCMDTRSNTDAICVLWLMKDKQKTEK